MSRLVAIPLVLMLSGVPAATVVCDLLLCAAPTKPPAPSTGCHDHAPTPPATRMTERADDCSHISSTDPYVTSAVRGVFQPVASLVIEPVAQGPIASFNRVHLISAHGPPGSLRLPPSLPLRI